MKIAFVRADDPWWAECFGRLPAGRRDIFYGPGFAQACQTTLNRDDEIWCAAAQTETGVLLYPFALRDLAALTDCVEAKGCFDMTGLYGRGGIACDDASLNHLPDFHRHIAQFAQEKGALCAFDRYHPVMGNDAWAAPDTRIMDVGGFVVLDMNRPQEEIEASYRHNVRKAIKKAERSGVETMVEEDGHHLDAFLDIYYGTMDRNNARDFYYFQRDFFEALHRHALGQFFYVHATLQDRIVSTELVLCDRGGYSHSFLGGTRADSMREAPNNLVKRDIVRHWHGKGGTAFLLGGGAAPDDGIFAYKKAFAPEGVLPSRIGGRIFDAAGLAKLRRILEEAQKPIFPNRFQFYDPN